MKVVLFALTGFGNRTLDALLKESCEVCFILTRKEKGPFPYYPEENLTEYCQRLGLEVYDDFSWNEIEKKIKDCSPDLILVSTFHKIIPGEIISSVPYCVNLHPSLLPKYAGATPFDWVLFNQEKKTGITAHYLTKEADKGDILIQKKINISKKDDKGGLINKLAGLAALVSRQLVGQIKKKSLKSRPQNLEDFQYLPKFKEGIAILGGYLRKDKNGRWRTSNLDEKDKFGVIGDRLRILAAYSLYLKNPGQILLALGGKGQLKKMLGAPTLAKIIKNELLDLGVSGEKIVLEEKSENTWQSLSALKKILIKDGIHRINIISNRYHLPRIRAFISSDNEYEKMFQTGRVKLLAAEEILIKDNPRKWRELIRNAYKTDEMKKRIKLEKKGISDLRKGIYGK